MCCKTGIGVALFLFDEAWWGITDGEGAGLGFFSALCLLLCCSFLCLDFVFLLWWVTVFVGMVVGVVFIVAIGSIVIIVIIEVIVVIVVIVAIVVIVVIVAIVVIVVIAVIVVIVVIVAIVVFRII